MDEIESIVYGIIESVMKSDKYNVEEKLDQVRVVINVLNSEKQRKAK